MFWERTVAPGGVRCPSGIALRRLHRAFFIAGLAILLMALLAACGRSQASLTETNDEYQVGFSTEPAPPRQGAGIVIVKVKDEDGETVDGARVAIEANMNHAGMKPEYAGATLGVVGEYRMLLNWSMGGTWYVDVKITTHSGDVVRRRFPVDVE